MKNWLTFAIHPRHNPCYPSTMQHCFYWRFAIWFTFLHFQASKLACFANLSEVTLLVYAGLFSRTRWLSLLIFVHFPVSFFSAHVKCLSIDRWLLFSPALSGFRRRSNIIRYSEFVEAASCVCACSCVLEAPPLTHICCCTHITQSNRYEHFSSLSKRLFDATCHVSDTYIYLATKGRLASDMLQ